MNSVENDIRKYILNRRTISFGNVNMNFNIPLNSLTNIIEEMELKGEIRINNSACSLDCSSCSSCDKETNNRIRSTSILVSIKRLF